MGNTSSEDAALAADLRSEAEAERANQRLLRLHTIYTSLDSNKDGSVSRNDLITAFRSDPEVRVLVGLQPLTRQEIGAAAYVEQVFSPLVADASRITIFWPEVESWARWVQDEIAKQGLSTARQMPNGYGSGRNLKDLTQSLELDTVTMWQEVSALLKDPQRLQDRCVASFHSVSEGHRNQPLMKPILREMASHFIGLFDCEEPQVIYQAVDGICPDSSTVVDAQMYLDAQYAILVRIEKDLRERLVRIKNGERLPPPAAMPVSIGSPPPTVAPSLASPPRGAALQPVRESRPCLQPPPTSLEEVNLSHNTIQSGPTQTMIPTGSQYDSYLDQTDTNMLDVTLESRPDPDIERTKADICAGHLRVKVYKVEMDGEYALEEKRLAVNPQIGIIAIFGDDGKMTKGFKTEEVEGILQGIPSSLLENPPPSELGLAFRFRDQYFCVLFDDADTCMKSVYAFSELCNAPIISEGGFR
mmetsp:Transcript_2459/g.5307  ORF Transcript_2459/g.5307 Transcript_2459/m.5307 type:complete len:473 (+) Transcript_2459:44-1462(+)